MATGFVNMKDAGDTDESLWVGWREQLHCSGWKRTGVKQQSLCVRFQSLAEKQGQEQQFRFACFILLRGKVLRMSVC